MQLAFLDLHMEILLRRLGFRAGHQILAKISGIIKEDFFFNALWVETHLYAPAFSRDHSQRTIDSYIYLLLFRSISKANMKIDEKNLVKTYIIVVVQLVHIR